MRAAGSSDPSAQASHPAGIERAARGAPLWLIAELTYRCPLHCVFCSNPVDYAARDREIGTEDWQRVFREARAMGSVQLGFSGGEPLLRSDLEALVEEARRLGYYTSLVTSGVGLSAARGRALRDAGLDHIQLSLQDSTRELNDFLSSTRTFERKREVAAVIHALGYPLVLNCVMHRYNLPHVGRLIDMGERLGADVLELAQTQYHGWARLNQRALMPAAQDLADAEALVDAKRQGLAGRMKILWVAPHEDGGAATAPRTNGGDAVFMVVAPDGKVVPFDEEAALPTAGVTVQPLRFVPGAVRGGGLWFRSDANSHALCGAPAAVESALLDADAR